MTAPEPTGPTDEQGGGSSRIGAALLGLAGVKDASPADQVEPLTQAHRALRETLDSIGDA